MDDESKLKDRAGHLQGHLQEFLRKWQNILGGYLKLMVWGVTKVLKTIIELLKV